jgi:hypothetical protein
MRKRLIFIIFLFALIVEGYSQEKISSDRFGSILSEFVVPKKSFQIEYGVSQLKTHHPRFLIPEEGKITKSPIESRFRYGLNDDLEINAGYSLGLRNDYTRLSPDFDFIIYESIVNYNFGLKFQMAQDLWFFDGLAFFSNIIVYDLYTQLEDDHERYINLGFVGGSTIYKVVKFRYSIEARVPKFSQTGIFDAKFGAYYSLYESLLFFADYNWKANYSSFGINTNFFTWGTLVYFTENLMWDVQFQKQFEDFVKKDDKEYLENFKVMTGLTWNFYLDKKLRR